MSSDEISSHKDLRPAQMQSSEHDVKRVLEAISGFTNPFSSSVEDNELYCLSSGVPAKPDIAKDLIEAQDIGRKAMEDFISTRLVEKSVGFHNSIKRNKLKTFAAIEVKKKMTSSQNNIEPTIDRPSNAVHVIDGNAILQSLTTIPGTFEKLAESVFNQLPKAERVDFVTDTYKQLSIKSYERLRRGTAPTHLLSGAKSKTPHD